MSLVRVRRGAPLNRVGFRASYEIIGIAGNDRRIQRHGSTIAADVLVKGMPK